MSWITNRSWPVQLVLAVTLGVILGATASAGTLYSWITEDGTHAYTNDQKRIPARYKAQAKKSQMKEMKKYDRFTPGPETQAAGYEDRLNARLKDLRDRPAVSAGPPPGVVGRQGPMVTLQGGGRFGTRGPGVALPVDSLGEDDDPIISENIRMKKAKGHNSTRHWTIVRKGDKVVAINKNSFNDGPPDGLREESDFDADPIAR